MVRGEPRSLGFYTVIFTFVSSDETIGVAGSVGKVAANTPVGSENSDQPYAFYTLILNE